MNTFKNLKDINTSGKTYVIYKTTKGFDLFTDFSKKIILSNKNIINFLKSISSNKKKIKKTDLYVGFFDYELLNQLIGINFSKQKTNHFQNGIFYKHENLLSLNQNLSFKDPLIENKNKQFKININRKNYTKIFNKFKKKIKQGKTYQIKICTKYKNKSKIDPLVFFCSLFK